MDNKQYTCRRSLCGKSFTLKNNRIRHENSCKKGDSPQKSPVKLECENQWCRSMFSKKFNLKQHVLICHQKKNKKTYICITPKCLKEFSTKANLKRHGETCSREKLLYYCDNCTAVHQRKDKFDIHVRSCDTSTTPICSNTSNNNNVSTLEYCSMLDISQHYSMCTKAQADVAPIGFSMEQM